MANALQQAGAGAEPTNFAPLHTNRIFTGLWTNRSPLRDAATSDYQEHYGMGRQDSILTGYNSEISARLTLKRRAGSSVYNANPIPPVKRFYSFNTFTLTDEVIRVMADTALTVYDATAPNLTPIFTKSAGAKDTFFLGVGNTLYFTNGVDNKQIQYDPATGTWSAVAAWGIDAPPNAPVATQAPRVNPYPGWSANVNYATHVSYNGTPVFNGLVIVGSDNNLQITTSDNTNLGTAEPAWLGVGQTTIDGSTSWVNRGAFAHKADFNYSTGELCIGYPEPAGTPPQLFVVVRAGMSGNGSIPVPWPAQIGAQISEGANLIWQNLGRALQWSDVGIAGQNNIAVRNTQYLVDVHGNLQSVYQMGRTGATAPSIWETGLAALTTDNTIIWQNAGPFAVPGSAPVIYGYAFMNSKTADISNMSPKSNPIVVIQGNQVTVQGDGSSDPQVDTIVLYRTAQGGSTFLELATFPNPPIGQKWTYIDNAPDGLLNTEWQAQVGGEGTPLPAGATCLGYHLGRIFAAVGNVVWISSGPDAVVGGSSGNAGFDIQLVAQSKITRFWACSLGMVVFTVRDAYIILGSATDADPLYMVVFIENLPLRSYDCFTVNKTTPYMLMGNNQLVALDPSAGIMEVGFPIADRLLDEYDSAASYVTYHSQSTLDTALYVANGAVNPSNAADHNGQWYRMSANNAPEQGSAWSTKALLAGVPMGCVQSVEVTPGVYRLLISSTATAPILQRDRSKNADNAAPFSVRTVFGNIVLAQPGQLAALSFITLESVRLGTRPGLALLLGEISGQFDVLERTRQDPPILPPSQTLLSDRYHFAQNQKEAWCRHFQMEITWPSEDAYNELLTYTIFGQSWQEMRSQ